MADFSTTQAGGPIGSSVTPKELSASQVGATALGGIADIVRIGGDAFNNAAKLEAKDKAAKDALAGNTILAKFTEEQLKLVDAYELGGITQAEARGRLRANLTKAGANNPALQEDLLNTHSKLMATAGLGKVIDEGTEAEQNRSKARAAAFAAGFGDSDTQVENYLKYQRSQERLKEAQAVLTYQNSKLEKTGKLTSNAAAQMQLEERIQIKAQETAMADMADAYAASLAEKVQEISQAFSSGKMKPEDAIAALNANRLAITNTIGAAGRKTGGDYINAVVSPMLETIDFAKKAISGEEPLASLENQVQNLITKQKLLAVTDPANARVVGVSQLLKNVGDFQANVINDAGLRMLDMSLNNGADSANPYTKDTKASKSYFEIIKTNLKRAGEGKLDDAGMKELNTVLTDVLEGTSAYSNSVKDLEQLKEVQNFFADPNFASYVKKNSGIPAETLSTAKDVVQQMYNDKVLPLVEKELKNAKVTKIDTKSAGSGVLGVMTSNVNAEETVYPVFSGGQVTFKSKGTGEGVTKARELNKTLAPVMNKMIKVTAHLDGQTDYQKYYDMMFGEMIGSGQVNAEGNP